MPTYKLYYFHARARAEIARILFALAGVEFEDCRLERSEWLAMKEMSPFGQIPLLEIDGTMMCQSHTIERYLARTFGFSGKTAWDEARADMIIECMEDYIKLPDGLFANITEEEKNELKRTFKEVKAPQYLNSLEKILKENKDWKTGHFIGTEITVADVAFFVMTNNGTYLTGETIPESWDAWPGLKSVREAVAGHPKIMNWIAKRPKTAF